MWCPYEWAAGSLLSLGALVWRQTEFLQQGFAGRYIMVRTSYNLHHPIATLQKIGLSNRTPSNSISKRLIKMYTNTSGPSWLRTGAIFWRMSTFKPSLNNNYEPNDIFYIQIGPAVLEF